MTSIAKDLDFKYDAIVVLSGDGGIHEVLNGLAQRPDGRKALTTPIAQIPTGSANALCVNVLGPEVFAMAPRLHQRYSDTYVGRVRRAPCLS